MAAYIHADPSPYVNELNYILASVDRITQNDRSIKADILEQRIVTDLFPAVYEHLHVEPTNEAVYIKRLFSIGGRPVAICRSHIPVKLAPGGPKRTRRSFYFEHTEKILFAKPGSRR